MFVFVSYVAVFVAGAAANRYHRQLLDLVKSLVAKIKK